MRKTLVSLLAASAAAAAFGFAPSASAVCGGGQPGEACYCPDGDLVNIKDIVVVRSPVNC